jgi:hypothetical protein
MRTLESGRLLDLGTPGRKLGELFALIRSMLELYNLSRTLELAYVLNARQPIVEKFGPYCVIGLGPSKIKLPLPIG